MGKTILIIVLALLVIGVGVLIYLGFKKSSAQTPTQPTSIRARRASTTTLPTPPADIRLSSGA